MKKILINILLVVLLLGSSTVAMAAGGDGGTVQIKNPIASQTFQEFVRDILNIVVTVSMPFLVVMVIYTGFKYVTARGNPTKIGQAHQMILWTIVGASIILGAFIIANAIDATIKALKADTGTTYLEELEGGQVTGDLA